MLNATKEKKGDALVVALTGTIEESVNFEEVIGEVSGELQVNCKGIPRINSVGVKSWIKYFQGLTDKGVKIKFHECSTAIVEQINLISNFSCGGEVESIYVPYSCTDCDKEFEVLYTTEQLKKLNFEVPEVDCPEGTGKAEFDDIPDEYFNFLMD